MKVRQVFQGRLKKIILLYLPNYSTPPELYHLIFLSLWRDAKLYEIY